MELDNVCHHLYHLHQVSYYEMMRSEERVRGEGGREGGREGEGKRVDILVYSFGHPIYDIFVNTSPSLLAWSMLWIPSRRL